MDEITNEDIYALLQSLRTDLERVKDTLGGDHGTVD